MKWHKMAWDSVQQQEPAPNGHTSVFENFQETVLGLTRLQARSKLMILMKEFQRKWFWCSAFAWLKLTSFECVHEWFRAETWCNHVKLQRMVVPLLDEGGKIENNRRKRQPIWVVIAKYFWHFLTANLQVGNHYKASQHFMTLSPHTKWLSQDLQSMPLASFVPWSYPGYLHRVSYSDQSLKQIIRLQYSCPFWRQLTTLIKAITSTWSPPMEPSQCNVCFYLL